MRRPTTVKALLSAALIAWAAVVFHLSTSGPPALPVVGPPATLETAGHAAMYLVVAGLLSALLADPNGHRRGDLARAALAILVATAYGAAMEGYQATLPGRDPSWADGAVNLAGATLGALGALGALAPVRRWWLPRQPTTPPSPGQGTSTRHR